MTANSEQKMKLDGIPDDAPAALHALARLLEGYPRLNEGIDRIELTAHDDDPLFREVQRTFDVKVTNGDRSSWAELRPVEGNEDRQVKVEITVFGSPQCPHPGCEEAHK